MAEVSSSSDQAPDTGRFFGRIPRWVWLVAAVVALGRMAPEVVAAWRTPEGWSFTGNVRQSPDFLQYRVWARQAQEQGPVISNRFTEEPNGRFLPVAYYWVVGKLATLTGISPEWVNAWLGIPLTVALVLVLFCWCRRFLRSPPAWPWTLGVMLLGGGLGMWLVLVRENAWLRSWHPLYILVVAPMTSPSPAIPFDDFRGPFIVNALLDTHFLVFWVVALLAVMALAQVTLAYRPRGLVVLFAAFAAATVLHVYEGITLLAAACGALALSTRRGLDRRHALAILCTAGAAVGLSLALLLAMQRAAGWPMPAWRSVEVPPLLLLLAYPVAWLLLVLGGARYWREAGREGAFLMGWALGCVVLVLSGPFYPYSPRGAMTLQVPLYLMAASIYFRDRRRVKPGHVALLLFLAGPTLVGKVVNIATERFSPHKPHIWISPAHERMIDALRSSSDTSSLLAADPATLRWLGPEYPGRHFAGHFFLTTNYAEKLAQLESFLSSTDPGAQASFLAALQPTHLFIPAPRDPGRFDALPGVTVLHREPIGTLFAVDAPAPVESPGSDGAP